MRTLTAVTMAVAVAAASLAGGGVARAKRAPEPAPAATGTRVAVTPLTSLTEGSKGLPKLEEQVAQGLGGVSGFSVVPGAELKKALKKAKRPELDACDGDAHCMAEVGRLVNATIVVAGDVNELAEGSIVYLKAVEVASEREIGSTTAVLDGPTAGAEARAAAVRLLAPKTYTGAVQLEVDVVNAVVYVDGQRVNRTPGKPLMLSVGQHALRVTHEQYRDWVRFVDVKFDETVPLAVNLKAFPVITDEMRQKDRPRPVGQREPLPWYRKWYTVAGVGVVLVVGTTILVAALSGGLDADTIVTVGGP
jgi:hypothetical protein